MATDLSYDLVLDRLIVGRYPQDPDDVQQLRDLGITAIVNLQSDEDFRDRAINWSAMWGVLTANRIAVARVPILDFAKDDLQRKMEEAVAKVHELRDEQGRTVYLHCNAGINRSPTVAIAYLALHHGMTPAQARDHVEQRHRCIPYMDVVERWLKKRK
jgi:protein-tyrosine phosphatase